MSRSDFSRITLLSEDFCELCFNDEQNENLTSLLDEMVEIIKKSDSYVQEELLLMFVEKGARIAFFKTARVKVNSGQSASEGITSDNDFKLFLDKIKIQYQLSKDLNIIHDIFNHLLSEVNSLSSEINVTTSQAYNSINETSKIQAKYVEDSFHNVNVNLSDVEKEITAANKSIVKSKRYFNKKFKEELELFKTSVGEIENKFHESNITILGVFASIVLVFNASVSFYAEAIKSFSSASSYKTLFFFSLIGVIILTAIMGLVLYLERVRLGKETNNNKKYKSKVIWPFITIILFLIIIMVLVWSTGGLENDYLTQSTVGQAESPTTQGSPSVEFNTGFFGLIPKTDAQADINL